MKLQQVAFPFGGGGSKNTWIIWLALAGIFFIVWNNREAWFGADNVPRR